MEFDFAGHQLHLRSSSGEQREVALEPKTVAEFYREIMAALDAPRKSPETPCGPTVSVPA
jgi:hypothetical protein